MLADLCRAANTIGDRDGEEQEEEKKRSFWFGRWRSG